MRSPPVTEQGHLKQSYQVWMLEETRSTIVPEGLRDTATNSFITDHVFIPFRYQQGCHSFSYMKFNN